MGAATGTALVDPVRAQGTPAVEVVSPQPGETVTTDGILVAVEIGNFEADCAQSGRPDEEGVGHIHIMIDGMSLAQLANLYCQDFFFFPDEELEGKPNVPGFGHWHLFVDTTDPMALMEEAMADMTPAAGEESHMAMPMPAMISMPGTNTFEVDLTAWGPGEHTIFIEPAQNDHTYFAEFDPVEFTVTVDPDATV